MTREEAEAEVIAAGGVPGKSEWMKYTIPERPTFHRFLSRHFSEMQPGEIETEVRARVDRICREANPEDIQPGRYL
jgi:hypothetical protein